MLRRLSAGNPVNTAHPLNMRLISWWLNTPSSPRGITFYDLMRRNSGTLQNGPLWTGVAGRSGGYGSLEFVGGTSRVQIPDSTSLVNAFLGNFTISMWVLKAANNTYYRLFSKGKESAPISRVDIFLGGTTALDNNVTFNLYQAGVLRQVRSPSGSFNSTNTWRHICAIYNQVNLSIGIDGVFSNQAQTGAADTTAGQVLYLGVFLNGTTHPLVGKIDSVRLYDYALSSNDVQALIQEEATGYSSTLNWLSTKLYFIPIAPAITFLPRVMVY